MQMMRTYLTVSLPICQSKTFRRLCRKGKEEQTFLTKLLTMRCSIRLKTSAKCSSNSTSTIHSNFTTFLIKTQNLETLLQLRMMLRSVRLSVKDWKRIWISKEKSWKSRIDWWMRTPMMKPHRKRSKKRSGESSWTRTSNLHRKCSQSSLGRSLCSILLLRLMDTRYKLSLIVGLKARLLVKAWLKRSAWVDS